MCDVDAQAALARARSWGASPERAYADWRELLADDSLDAVEILLPHHLHFEVGMAAIACLALGLAERDGLAVIVGYVLSAASVVILAAVSSALYAGVVAFFQALFGV